MVNLSYSKLRLWNECELKFCAQELLDFPASAFLDTDPMVQLGQLLHNIFNDFYRNHAQVNLFRTGREKLEVLIERFRQDWYQLAPKLAFTKDTMVDATFEIGLAAIENFWKREEQAGFQVPLFLEKSFSLRLEDCVINGRIDRLDQARDDSYTVIDYKISHQCRTQSDIDQDKQLTLYALACVQVLTGVMPVRVGLYYPIQDKVFYSRRTESQITELLEEITRIAILISERGSDPSLYQHSPQDWKCESCSYMPLCPAHRYKYDQEMPQLEMMLDKARLFAELKAELKPKEASCEALKSEIREFMLAQNISQLGQCRLSKTRTYDYEVSSVWEILSTATQPERFIKKVDVREIEKSMKEFTSEQVKQLKHCRTAEKIIPRISISDGRED